MPTFPTTRPEPWSRAFAATIPTATTTTTGTDEATAPAIAIVTHDSRADVERHIDGQAAAAQALESPLVVVDNDSGDGTPDLVAERVPPAVDLRLVRMGRNQGYAAAVNAAFRAADGRDVMLVNPDVELTGAAEVRALAGTLALHPALAVAAPRLLGDGGATQASARRFPSLLTLLGSLPPAGRLPFIRRSYERYLEPSRASHAGTVDWVIGAAMLIRRRAFEQVDGWDERFFLYVEDLDFCRRCRRAGWQVAYVPSVVLSHRYERASRSELGSAATSSARRAHMTGFARLFTSEPRLLFGGGRSQPRALADPVLRPDKAS